MKHVFFWMVICLAANTLTAQSFPNNREKFAKEFQRLMNEFGKSYTQDFSKKRLTPALLESNEFSEANFTKMVETCNALEAKRLKMFPVVYNYVFSYYSLVHGQQTSESINNWNATIDKLLASKTPKKLEDFIDFSQGFFSERRLVEESGHSWFFHQGAYSFSYENDQPFVQFEVGKLVCAVINTSKKSAEEQPFLDSIVVYETAGIFDPLMKKWTGTGGRITWEKVGLDPAKTFATLERYQTSLRSSNFNLDTVRLTSPYFAEPVLGKLSERAFKIMREDDKTYPSFISFEKRLRINNIQPNVNYEGSFQLKGKDFVGVGTTAEPAKLFVMQEGKVKAKMVAQLFIINSEKLEAMPAATTFYFGVQDSIYHPGLHFLYELKPNKIQFKRGMPGIGQTPFANSYHQLDMYVQKLVWEYGASNVNLTYDFGISETQRIARLESVAYYDGQLYDRLQGLESVHPLLALYNYAYKYDENTMPEGKAATALGKTIDQVRPTLLTLSSYGFISFDSEAKTITINPKLIHFINAKSAKKDFDNLSFVSDLRPKSLEGYTPEQIAQSPELQQVAKTYREQTEKRRLLDRFGYIDLSTMKIHLDAVDQVRISDPQNTAVFPSNNAIVIGKNRNFDFQGFVNAGKLEVLAQQANFDYEANKISLLQTEYGRFRVRPMTEKDGKEAIPMGSAIAGLIGEILIDAPNNRSANSKKITDFPKLVVTNKPKIYYNDRSIYRGAYDSSRFYFTLNAFSVDSLDNFAEKKLILKGELTSAGIFPKFKDSVRIMPDYSFGFSTQAPKEGYTFYGTSAKYNNKIVLSNNGLQGAGVIEFIHSISDSKAFTFLPDSTIGFAEFVNKPVEQGVSFPDVTAKRAFITYVPKAKMLKAASTPQEELVMFNKEVKLNGVAVIQEKGMTGKGIINMKDAALGSDRFRFTRWDADADTANFNLKNKYQEEDEDPLSVKTDNVNAHISFKERKGVFKSNAGESKVVFPVNQYLCKMDMLTWFMDQESLELAKNNAAADINIDAGLNLATPNFFSIHPKQDSLQFRAPKAKYSMKEKTIYCSNTEYIDVADARIYPDSMKVVIRKKAELDPLDNSRIVANYITKYHQFVEARTRITARRAYTSAGKYPYYDADSNRTYITMTKIGLDTLFQTVAEGKIGSDANFKLSKYFDYYGDIRIKAANPLITFAGATRINHDCAKFTKSWMSFTSEIDPKNIQIPVSEKMKTLEGNPISAGIVWRDSKDMDSVKLYPTFLSSLMDANDPNVMTASGYLQYDAGAKEFQIGSREKLAARNSKGNFLALHTPSCSLNGEGEIQLGMNYGEVSVQSVGTINYNQQTGETSMNLTARIALPIDKGSLEKVGQKIKATEGLNPLELRGTTLEQAFVQWTDQKTADKLKEEYLTKGDIRKLPRELEQAIVVTGLKLVSYDRSDNPEKNGLISKGNEAVLVSFFEQPVLRSVPTKAYFQQNYSENVTGDRFGIFFSIPGGMDYFFDYGMTKRDGELKVITNDTDYEKTINEMKEDKRKSKNFNYQATLDRVMLSIFMRLFEN